MKNIAQNVGTSCTTVYRWIRRWRKEGHVDRRNGLVVRAPQTTMTTAGELHLQERRMSRFAVLDDRGRRRLAGELDIVKDWMGSSLHYGPWTHPKQSLRMSLDGVERYDRDLWKPFDISSNNFRNSTSGKQLQGFELSTNHPLNAINFDTRGNVCAEIPD